MTRLVTGSETTGGSVAAETPYRISVDQLAIASPCPARWEDMEGTATRRMCADCGLHVHNVSGMNPDEVSAFLGDVSTKAAAGERVCIRLYRRTDGTVLTKNCPIGFAEMRRRAWSSTRRIMAAGALCIVGLFVGRRVMADVDRTAQGWGPVGAGCSEVEPLGWVIKKIREWGVAQQSGFWLGGVMRMPPKAPTFTQHLGDLAGVPREKTWE